MGKNRVLILPERLEGARRTLLEMYEVRNRGVITTHKYPVLVAGSDLRDAIVALVVGLDGIAAEYLARADDLLTEWLRGRSKPFLGFEPDSWRPYWDDEELNYHHAEVLICRYEVGILIGKSQGAECLRKALGSLEAVVANTDGLRGKISANANRIISDGLWASVIAGEPDRFLALATDRVGQAVTPHSQIRAYSKDSAYVRMLIAVARFASGSKEFENAARCSLKHLLALHFEARGDFTRESWPSNEHAFRWGWLWKRIIRGGADVARTIGLLRAEKLADDS